MRFFSHPCLIIYIFFLIQFLIFLPGLAPAENATLPSSFQKIVPDSKNELDKDVESFGEKIPDWKARWELAKLLSYVEKYQESIEEYQKLLTTKPNLYQAKLELAKVLYWAKKTEEAKKIFEALPKDKLKGKAKIDLADLYVSQNEFSKASRLYSQYLKEHSDDDKVRFKLAEVLSWLKEYNQSAHHFRILLEHQPENVQIRRNYAQVLIWSKKYDQAITQLRQSLQD